MIGRRVATFGLAVAALGAASLACGADGPAPPAPAPAPIATPATDDAALRLETPAARTHHAAHDAPVETYATSFDLAPTDPVVGLAYAEALIGRARLDEAGRVLDRVATGSSRPVVVARVALDRTLAIVQTTGDYDQVDYERLADAAVAAAQAAAAPVIEGRALGHRAMARLFLGRPDEATADSDRAITALTRADDRVGLCHLHRVRAVIIFSSEPHVEAALAAGQRAAALCEEVGDDVALALALNLVGGALTDLGRLDEVEAAYLASIAAAERAGRPDQADCCARSNLANFFQDRGDLRTAQKLHDELSARRALNVSGLVQLNLADLARMRGDLAAGQRALDLAGAELDATRNQTFRSTQSVVEAMLAFEADDRARVQTALRRAAAQAKAAGSGAEDWNLNLARGRVALAHDDPAAAAALLVPAAKLDGLTAAAQGVITYLAGRALLAAGRRAEARVLRDRERGDPRWPRYAEARVHAALLDAELATTPAERTAARGALATLVEDLRRYELTVGRWEVELGLARLEGVDGATAAARGRIAGVRREAAAAGFLRMARAADTLAAKLR